MDVDTLVSSLGLMSEKNDALRLLESIVVDKDRRLTQQLAQVIREPAAIDDTNRFASLLVDLPSGEYIEPLTEAIASSAPGVSSWLSDYLYALGSLLEGYDEDYVPNDEFVHKLGTWLTTTGGGEISWKSGIILSEVASQVAYDYLFQGARDSALFHQTRIVCIRGVVNHFQSEAEALLSELINDPSEQVREAAHDAVAWLKGA